MKIDGLFDTGLSTLLDVVSLANALAGAAGAPTARFEVQLAGMRRRIRTGQGFSRSVPLASSLKTPEVVVLPAMGAKFPDTVTEALKLSEVKDAQQQLQAWSKRGALVCAACTGTFVLAGSGLLDGQTATTSWWLAPCFRQLFPEVALDEARMLVESDRFVTAGAALGHLDLALWLVRRSSPALAAMVARYLVVDSRPSQAAFVIPDHLAHTDPLVERFEAWARGRLGERFSLHDAAVAAGASERTLSRRMRRVLGKGPLSYVQDLRVERAVHRLQTSSASVDEIAAEVGYSDGVTLRSLLRRKIGRGVRELRLRS